MSPLVSSPALAVSPPCPLPLGLASDLPCLGVYLGHPPRPLTLNTNVIAFRHQEDRHTTAPCTLSPVQKSLFAVSRTISEHTTDKRPHQLVLPRPRHRDVPRLPFFLFSVSLSGSPQHRLHWTIRITSASAAATTPKGGCALASPLLFFCRALLHVVSPLRRVPAAQLTIPLHMHTSCGCPRWPHALMHLHGECM